MECSDPEYDEMGRLIFPSERTGRYGDAYLIHFDILRNEVESDE